MKAHSVIVTSQEVAQQVAELNNRLKTNINFVSDGDFNNVLSVKLGGNMVQLGKGSLSVLKRNLRTFEVGFLVGNDKKDYLTALEDLSFDITKKSLDKISNLS